jgi:hypothetical protein
VYCRFSAQPSGAGTLIYEVWARPSPVDVTSTVITAQGRITAIQIDLQSVG